MKGLIRDRNVCTGYHQRQHCQWKKVMSAQVSWLDVVMMNVIITNP